MTTLLPTYWRRQPPFLPRPNLTLFGGSLVGLVSVGNWGAIDIVNGRQLTVTAGTSSQNTIGECHTISSTTGVYTGRKGAPNWELGGPLTFFVYAQFDTIGTGTQCWGGYTNGSDGIEFYEKFGTGTRLYGSAGGGSITASGAWGTGTPFLAAIRYDGSSVLEGLYNGVSDGTQSGVGPITYGAFAHLFFGNNTESGMASGAARVWYFGLCSSLIPNATLRRIYAHPFSVYEPYARRFDINSIAAAGNVFNPLSGRGGTVAQPLVMH